MWCDCGCGTHCVVTECPDSVCIDYCCALTVSVCVVCVVCVGDCLCALLLECWHCCWDWQWLLKCQAFLPPPHVLMCQSHLFPSPDPTLTSTKLAQLLSTVDDWSSHYYSVPYYLDIPDSVQFSIESQHHKKSELVEALMKWYLTHHPAPSWTHVMSALYDGREHAVLQTLRGQLPHLKGRSGMYPLMPHITCMLVLHMTSDLRVCLSALITFLYYVN